MRRRGDTTTGEQIAGLAVALMRRSRGLPAPSLPEAAAVDWDALLGLVRDLKVAPALSRLLDREPGLGATIPGKTREALESLALSTSGWNLCM